MIIKYQVQMTQKPKHHPSIVPVARMKNTIYETQNEPKIGSSAKVISSEYISPQLSILTRRSLFFQHSLQVIEDFQVLC